MHSTRNKHIENFDDFYAWISEATNTTTCFSPSFSLDMLTIDQWFKVYNYKPEEYRWMFCAEGPLGIRGFEKTDKDILIDYLIDFPDVARIYFSPPSDIKHRLNETEAIRDFLLKNNKIQALLMSMI